MFLICIHLCLSAVKFPRHFPAIAFSRQIRGYTTTNGRFERGMHAALAPIDLITCEVIELLRSNDNLTISSDHNGLEETTSKKR